MKFNKKRTFTTSLKKENVEKNTKISLMKLWSLLNKDISVKKKQKRIFRFNETKWILFASLLENGYSVDDCLLIMNEKINIKKYMEEGKKLEELILQGQNGVFYDHLSFFIQFMSLSKYLDWTIN